VRIWISAGQELVESTADVFLDKVRDHLGDWFTSAASTAMISTLLPRERWFVTRLRDLSTNADIFLCPQTRAVAATLNKDVEALPKPIELRE
jgi:hypothetical protein